MVKSTPLILLGILLQAGLAAVFIFLALRLTAGRRNANLAFTLFLVAVIFGIAAIATITFMGKSKSG
ncbi:MAG TPA: hypothetical protein VLS53_06210 [Candidatus Dormibacteraeota bacterium]|nr:hypothetical protein [Candidatus Dormibacteraeota bacterium]